MALSPIVRNRFWLRIAAQKGYWESRVDPVDIAPRLRTTGLHSFLPPLSGIPKGGFVNRADCVPSPSKG